MSSPQLAPQSGPAGEVYILSATRTPLGAFQGALATVPAPQLGAVAVRGAMEQAKLEPGLVTEVYLGQTLQAGAKQAPARQAALGAGLGEATRCTTVNKVCGSGLQAVIFGAQSILIGSAEIVLAGGMENMSAAPYLVPGARAGLRLGHRSLVDSILEDGLSDAGSQQAMGSCAEHCATKYQISRAEQDAYAAESFRRANAAQQSGAFAQEITAVPVTDAKGVTVSVDRDEGPAKVKYEKIPLLKPAFERDGTITAANASTLNDGAAALVLAGGEACRRLGKKPLARIVSYAGHAHEPLWFTTAPITAARRALERAGWATQDVDIWEVNEAFAVVPIAFARELGIGLDRVNVRGGAIALGHPIGASGARILVTLLSAMQAKGARRGVAAICIGGGEGLAMCVERLENS